MGTRTCTEVTTDGAQASVRCFTPGPSFSQLNCRLGVEQPKREGLQTEHTGLFPNERDFMLERQTSEGHGYGSTVILQPDFAAGDLQLADLALGQAL